MREHEQENIRLVQQVYEDHRRADVASILRVLTADVRWERLENDVAAAGGRESAQPGHFFRRTVGIEKVVAFEAERAIAQANRVVVLGHLKWLGSSGEQGSSDWAHVWTVRDGRVTHFCEYIDAGRAGGTQRNGCTPD